MSTYEDLANRPITLVTQLPGPRAREAIARAMPYLSPSLIHCYPLMIARAAGCMVQDVDGNILLDCESGIAVTATGHCHPRVAAAMKEQVDTLIHMCGTDFHYPGYGALCERLARVAPGGESWQTFLTNSGTEAVEAAIKLARHHTGRHQLVSFRGGFHGRTLGSLSLTASKPKYKKGFGPLLPGVSHADFNDPASVHKLLETTVPASEVAAVFVEPILGEGGYIPARREFLVALRDLCDRHGMLLAFDEVQTGIGRTGRMFAADLYGVVPDILILGKGLASGMPLGAMMAPQSVMTWTAGTHGSTFWGNPVCIAAALATLDLVEGGLLDNAAEVGRHLMATLGAGLIGKGRAVVDVRGVGLMIGVELETPEQAGDVANLCYQRGLLLLECGKKAIRFAPPLIITRAQADAGAEVFIGACADVARGVKPQPPIEAEGHEEGI